MKIRDFLWYKTQNKQPWFNSWVFPKNDFDVLSWTYNFNAPYLKAKLISLKEWVDIMCLTPSESQISQVDTPIHEDRTLYLDTRNKNNVFTIDGEFQEITLDRLQDFLKDNLNKNPPHQEQFFIRKTWDNQFEYHTVPDINKKQLGGVDVNDKIVNIFDKN